MRASWKRNYLYVKRIMEGLLIRAGREAEYPSLFLDLQTTASNGSSVSSGAGSGSTTDDGGSSNPHTTGTADASSPEAATP